MVLFRPSTIRPIGYLQCIIRGSTTLKHAASSGSLPNWQERGSGRPVDDFTCKPVAALSVELWQRWVHALYSGLAVQHGSGHRWYTKGRELRPTDAHTPVGHCVKEDREHSGGQVDGRTAFGDAVRHRLPGAPALPLSRLRSPWLPPKGVRTHMGHSHEHAAHEAVPSEGEKVVRLGFWSDIGLTIGKAAAGYISGSTAMIADAAHSFSDIALSGVSLWSVRAAAMPKDKEHPYGHGKYESLGAFGVSVLLIGTGAGIAWNALEALQVTMGPALALASAALPDAVHVAAEQGLAHSGHSHAIDRNNLGIALAASLLSIAVKEALYRQTKKVGEQTGSQLLMANAWHHRSDAVSSLVALVGVGGAYLGVPWLDPVAGMLLAGMIVKAGFDISTNSIKELVDASVPDSILSSLRATVLAVPGVRVRHGRAHQQAAGSDVLQRQDPKDESAQKSSKVTSRAPTLMDMVLTSVVIPKEHGVEALTIAPCLQGVRRVRARKMGPNLVCDLTIDVDPFLSVSAAHNLAEVAQLALRKKNPSLVDVIVHVEPDDAGHDEQLPPHQAVTSARGQSRGEAATEWPAHVARAESGPGQEHGHSSGGARQRDAVLDDRIQEYPLQSDVEAQIRGLVSANFHQVVLVSHVTCHFLESGTIARVTIQVDPAMTVKEAARLGRRLEEELQRSLTSIKEADVHLELNSHADST